MTKTVAIELCRKAIETRTDEHGHIDASDLRNALLDLIEQLERDAEADDEPTP